jgi:hypothetical protein
MVARLATEIERHGIGLVGLDPFIKTHSVEENDNSAIDDVVTMLTQLAAHHDVAVDILHHTSKGLADPGNANRGRGASAMKDGGRLVYTLTQMSAEEAQRFDIPEAERRSYVRMDSGKVNIAPATEATWFRIVGVPLANGSDLYPAGDTVPTVVPWTPPDAWKDLNHHLLNRILDDIDAGLPDGNRYTNTYNAGDREAWRVVAKHATDKSENQAKEIIKTWIRNGVLVRYDYENPTTRKSVKGLRTDPKKRPT